MIRAPPPRNEGCCEDRLAKAGGKAVEGRRDQRVIWAAEMPAKATLTKVTQVAKATAQASDSKMVGPTMKAVRREEEEAARMSHLIHFPQCRRVLDMTNTMDDPARE